MFVDICNSINSDVFKNMREKSLAVFLVGAGRGNQNSIREPVRKELTRRSYLNWIDVYYPEYLFDELIGNRANYNLLTLENMLAKSVHSVVILLESPGSFTELGAFSNHKALCNKLVVVVDKKFKTSKSFILLGPIRHLEENTDSIIIYYDFTGNNTSELGTKIKQAVRKMSSNVSIDMSVSNIIAAQYYMLSAIYVMQPVKKDIITKMVSSLGVDSFDEAVAIGTSSINILLRRKEIIFENAKYNLSPKGIARLFNCIKHEPKEHQIKKSLDKLRVQILNCTLRRNRSFPI